MQFALVAHILAMGLGYGLLLPVSVMMGLAKSKFHFPMQLLTACVAGVGYISSFLIHTGYHYTAHKGMGFFMVLVLAVQLVCGAYTLLFLRNQCTVSAETSVPYEASLWKRYLHRILPPVSANGDSQGPVASLSAPARWVRFVHKWIDIFSLLWAYMEIVMGTMVTLGICFEPETGRCAAHFIKGSILVGYGVVQLVLLHLGVQWLARRQRPVEYFESLLCMLFGTVTILHEHRPGSSWSHRDIQHTVIGVVFLFGGLGAFLVTSFTSIKSRPPIIALIYLFVGLSMGFHHQEKHLSTQIHGLFGASFALASVSRLIELVCLSSNPSSALWSMHSFQSVTSFFCMLAGYILMGSTNGQVDILLAHKVDAGSYAMLHVSFAFFTFAYVLGMICLYQAVRGKPVMNTTNEDAHERHDSRNSMDFEIYHQNRAYQPVSQHGDASHSPNVNHPSFENSNEEKGPFNRL
ncbi:hypothetical protein IWQ62_003121 [Dispira parvispora]|uniref:Uncharacterized protein n=1 Tax=Dispira parvispora TaxID=1520584 RepID=A0A9W8ARG5_9FUNG|nr:hypothetical protein IWQ62_003121 [Dispira parvispora]